MSHKPQVGVLPPGASVRIDFVPPLTDIEQPMLLTVSGTNSIVMTLEERDHLYLTNQTRKHAPFILLVIPQNPSLNVLFDLLRQRMGG